MQRLAVLREVARCGSFAGAAATLRHTPSAVSQQIAALERSAGVTLVERSTRGVVLTDAGQILLAAADTIHAEVLAAERQLNNLRTDGPSTLTVVTFPSAGEPLLAPALTAMAAGHHVEVTVIEAEPDQALHAIRGGEADIALVYHFHTPQPPRHWPGTAGFGAYTPLLVDHLRLVVPTSHPLADRTAVSVGEVVGERWVQGWGEPGSVLDTLAAHAGFHPNVACRSSDYRFMSALVGAGVGVALIPHLALCDHPRVRAINLVENTTRHVGAYLPRRHRANRTAERLMQALVTQAATYAP
ncbi:LysR family transcriptional regulator [Dactylosporangium sp. NPDC048998]|uniref:LysR family transcriptional regulator n=1 Tax=Dactylosporangium sp. NPDC048998 TaxID=3363976 RepID=UPI0037156AEA